MIVGFELLSSVVSPPGASVADTDGWSSEQLVTFLDKLHEYRSMTPLDKKVSAALAKVYNMYEHKNCEIRQD